MPTVLPLAAGTIEASPQSPTIILSLEESKGEPGAPGQTGAQGSNAFSRIIGTPTVPNIGSSVTVNVVDASWISVGQTVYVDGANGSGASGDFKVTGLSGNTVTLLNLSASSGAGGGGDMFKAQYDLNNNGIVDAAETVPWAGTASGRPATFPPDPHKASHVTGGSDVLASASVSTAGLLNVLSGSATDYVGGDNVTHPLTNLLPTGSVIDYAGPSTTPPTGWLFCLGQEVSRATFSALYTALGGAASPWGQGNGTTTFNLPDLRGRVSIGVGQGNYSAATNRLLAGNGGEENHLLTAAEIASHSHGMSHTHGMANHTHAGVNHLHDLSNHTHVGTDHTHGDDHYHGIAAGQFSHSHSYINPTGGAGSQPGSGQYSAVGATNTSTTALPGGSTNYKSQQGFGTNTGGADRTLTTGGPSPNSTGAADRDLTTSGPSTNTTDASSIALTGVAGGGGIHNNMQPFVVLNRIIRT